MTAAIATLRDFLLLDFFHFEVRADVFGEILINFARRGLYASRPSQWRRLADGELDRSTTFRAWREASPMKA